MAYEDGRDEETCHHRTRTGIEFVPFLLFFSNFVFCFLTPIQEQRISGHHGRIGRHGYIYNDSCYYKITRINRTPPPSPLPLISSFLFFMAFAPVPSVGLSV
ncbi:hypothetical protein LX32DRAFT_136797 [Colletotrichum zoysiae]|uniref:Uncharacterized protein n=1 Tax=Colletotrichum zoysiae TaxID=1216348 RepID=A0AAD9H8X9_9PEZI|nr:hypothetical protein LX32DRAFT_136797 [Colletotrichum zoysiae]